MNAKEKRRYGNKVPKAYISLYYPNFSEMDNRGSWYVTSLTGPDGKFIHTDFEKVNYEWFRNA